MRHLKNLWTYLAFFCLTQGTWAIEPDPNIPPDTVLVAHFRPRQLFTSSLVKDQGLDEMVKTTLASIGPVSDFLDTSGLRIDRDVESVLVCMSNSPFTVRHEALAIDGETGEVIQPKAGEKPAENWLLIARGKFNPKKLAKALENQSKAAGAPVRKIRENGHSLFQLTGPEGPLFVSLDGNTRILLSNNPKNLGAILEGGFSKPVRRELVAAMEKVSGEESLWVAQGLDKEARENLEEENEDLKGLTKELQGGIFTLTVTDGLKGSFEVLAGSRPAAEAVKTSVAGSFQEVGQQLEEAVKEFNKSNDEHDPLERLGGMVEVVIALGFIRNSNLAVVGTDFSCTMELNRKKIDQIVEIFKPAPK